MIDQKSICIDIVNFLSLTFENPTYRTFAW